MDNSCEQAKCPLCEPGIQIRDISTGTIKTSLLEDEIKRTEKSIAELMENSAAIKRELNVQRSPIYKLPVEVLTRIFENLVPHGKKLSLTCSTWGSKRHRGSASPQRYPRLLGQVSSSWRQLLPTMPSLWSTVILEPSAHQERIVHTVHTLKLFLRNSGNLPFHLEFELRSHTNEFWTEDTDMLPIENLIFRSEHTSRFQSLHLIKAPSSWLALACTTAFSSLSSFRWSTSTEPVGGRRNHPAGRVDDYDHHRATYSLDQMISLSRLILSDISAYVRLPTSVTTLHLNEVSGRTLVDVLTHCVYVRVLYWSPRSDLDYCPPNPILQAAVVTLPALQFMSLSSVPDNLWALLAHFRFPDLRVVDINFSFEAEAICPPLMDFLRHLPLTIHKIGLGHHHFSSEDLRQILLPHIRLQTLSLYGSVQNIEEILQMMTPEVSSGYALPILREIILDTDCECHGIERHWDHENRPGDGNAGEVGGGDSEVNENDDDGSEDDGDDQAEGDCSWLACRCFGLIQWKLIEMLDKRVRTTRRQLDVDMSRVGAQIGVLYGKARGICSTEFKASLDDILGRHSQLKVVLPYNMHVCSDEEESGDDDDDDDDDDDMA
ncbi:hypothetical protein NP233_g7328 [Leucocoprinus birnbaumii]|uniref:F-box domain-containing protein n=1 Tax=Leucocoprinus birnbaumii TaxID=56174 RepID=A0AAD5YSW2_9AGAR|nr:hypothetical protein NP233_g7328 [Leucocoprinus birnbaumii]